MQTKVCTKCKKEKPLTEFSSSNPTSDGYNSWCKGCVNKASRKWSKTASGIYSTIKARVNFCRKNHNGYRSGSKRKMNISRKEFIEWYDNQPRVCHYCGLREEALHSDGDMYNDKINRLTVDCMDNNLGYVKDNLILCCGRCNSIKSDFLSYDEMKYIGRYMVAKRWK